MEGRAAEPRARLRVRKGRLLRWELEEGREGRRERKRMLPGCTGR